MRTLLLWLALVLVGVCQEPKPKRTIEDYVGRWVTPTMSELFLKQGFDEMAADIRAGKMPLIQDLSDEEKAELEEELGKPLSKVTGKDMQKILPPFAIASMMEGPMAELRMGIEITAESRLIFFFIVMGEEEVGSDELAKFTLTDEEIVYKTESDSGLIFLDGDNLKMENEEVGNYPRFFSLTREEVAEDADSANAEPK